MSLTSLFLNFNFNIYDLITSQSNLSEGTVNIFPFFPGGSVERICLPVHEMQAPSLGWEDPWKKATHSIILAGKNLIDRGAWRATVPVVTKSLILNNSNKRVLKSLP